MRDGGSSRLWEAGRSFPYNNHEVLWQPPKLKWTNAHSTQQRSNMMWWMKLLLWFSGWNQPRIYPVTCSDPSDPDKWHENTEKGMWLWGSIDRLFYKKQNWWEELYYEKLHGAPENTSGTLETGLGSLDHHPCGILVFFHHYFGRGLGLTWHN